MSIAVKTNTPIKEEEIRPDDLFEKFMSLSAADAERFFDRSQFEDVCCPGCASAKAEKAFQKYSFQYVECVECGSLYVSPRPSRAELARYYATSQSQTFWVDTILKKTGEKRKESILIPNLERVQKLLSDLGKALPRRILDVGAANGAFLSEWKKRHPEAELIGIEPGEEAARQCRETGAHVFEGFIENECEHADAEGDVVTCFEVMEHVHDPKSFAESIYKVTAPGGLAIITCLGADGFDIQVLWEKSRSVMPPYHLNFLSRKGMEALFSGAGFKSVEILTPGRMDVSIVERSIARGVSPDLSRFEKLLLSRGEAALKDFQAFLAIHGLSSHVWILCHR